MFDPKNRPFILNNSFNTLKFDCLQGFQCWSQETLLEWRAGAVHRQVPLADLGGAWGTHAPPGRPNSFDFMQFSGKFGVFTPPLEGSRPPLGKILDPPLSTVSSTRKTGSCTWSACSVTARRVWSPCRGSWRKETGTGTTPSSRSMTSSEYARPSGVMQWRQNYRRVYVGQPNVTPWCLPQKRNSDNRKHCLACCLKDQNLCLHQRHPLAGCGWCITLS